MVERQPEIPNQRLHNLNVPLIGSEKGNWCGYDGLAMILKYYGYDDLTSQKIFEHMKEKYDVSGIHHFPTIDHIGLAIRDLTTLKADLWTKERYKKTQERLQEKDPNLTLAPVDVLKTYLIKRGAPCIVRIPGHFLVARGYDGKNDEFIFNSSNPGGASIRRIRAHIFANDWAKNIPYSRNTSNLMLAVYPQTQNP